MTHTLTHSYQFDSGVRASVVQRVKQLRGQDSQEPSDFFVLKTELWVNEEPANERKYWKLVGYVLKHGQPF